MFNIKKIEPKFANSETIKRKPSLMVPNSLTFLDFDISESNVYSETLEKTDFIPIKKTKMFRSNTYKLFNDNISETTKCSEDKSIKKVTFSTVEIIRIKKFKKYNARNNFPLAEIQKNLNDVKKEKKYKNEASLCIIF